MRNPGNLFIKNNFNNTNNHTDKKKLSTTGNNLLKENLATEIIQSIQKIITTPKLKMTISTKLMK